MKKFVVTIIDDFNKPMASGMFSATAENSRSHRLDTIGNVFEEDVEIENFNVKKVFSTTEPILFQFYAGHWLSGTAQIELANEF